MSLSLALLRADLRTHLGVDDSDLSNTDADRLLNRSWWQLSAQLRFNTKEAETSFTTVIGTREYTIPTSSDAIQRVVIKGPNDDDYISLIKIDDWNMFAHKDTVITGVPTHYSRRNTSFILWPNPDDVYSILVKYLKTLTDIESTGPAAPQEWHEVVLWGAVSRGFFALGDWTRGTQAQAQELLHVQSLSTQDEREVEDRPYSGFTVLKRRYP